MALCSERRKGAEVGIFGGFSLLLYFSAKRKKRRKYTKHFYIEGQRIVSKLGAQSEAQFVKSTHAGDSIAAPVQWDKKKERSKDIIIANFEALGLDGAVFTAGKSGKMPYGQTKQSFKGFRGSKGFKKLCSIKDLHDCRVLQ